MNAELYGVTAFAASIFMLTVMFGSWFTIDQGEIGVLKRNGAGDPRRPQGA